MTLRAEPFVGPEILACLRLQRRDDGTLDNRHQAFWDYWQASPYRALLTLM